jgi:hypothetical protein
MERQAVTFCPALRQIVVDRGSLFEHLVHSGKTVIILDDADELPADQREQAMTGLTRAMPDTCPFSVFSREAFPELKLLRGARLTVATPTATQVRDYLRQMIRDQDERTAWAPVLARLGGRRHGQMADLLTTPLFAFLAWRVCTAGVSLDAPGHVMTPQQLADLVDDQGVTVAQDELMDEYIRLCVGDAGRWRGREDRRWLHRLAREMLRRPGASLAWWDLTDLVPAPVRVAAPTVLLVLAYLATLHMPQGFTRGLAIGIGTGLVLGLLRGTTVRPYLAVTAGVLAAAAIAAVGAAFYGWRYGAADGVELGAAYALILLLRSRLIGSWQSAVISVIAIAAGSALATWAALAAGGRLALGGGPLAVFGSMATGIGLGTLASHVFAADLHDPPRPSQVDLRLAAGLGSPLAHIARVLPPIVLIGLIAGLGGVIQKSPHYGYQILIIFGLGIGLPLAVVSGLLRWRSQLLPSRSTATARTTFRNDWRVAVACVTLPAVVSTVIIALFRAVGGAVAGPGGPAGLHVPVWDGLVFGVGLGVVLASLVAASPAVLVAHLWLTLTRRLPWRLLRFLERYHQRPRQLLRQQGPLYQFAHMRLMDRLADSRE